MNLGFDLDEVISHTATMSINHVNDIFECNLDINVFNEYWFDKNKYSDDPEIQKAAVECLEWTINDEKMMMSIEPVEDSIRVLNLFRKMGHKIFILTKRPDILKESTVKWLQQNRIPYDKLALTNGEGKDFWARRWKLDCFVDDLEENLYSMYNGKMRWRKGLMLMTRPWNENSYIDSSKFIRVNNWNDILQQIQIGNRLRG